MGKFRDWIVTQGGSTRLSKKLGLTRHAINSWLRYEYSPETHLAVRLVRLGRGAFDHNDIVADTYKVSVRRRRAALMAGYRK